VVEISLSTKGHSMLLRITFMVIIEYFWVDAINQ